MAAPTGRPPRVDADADRGLNRPEVPRAVVARSVVESIAAATAAAVEQLAAITGTPRDEVVHVGGATRMELFNDLLATHTGLPVRVGSPEAAALGNALLQGVALGIFDDVDDGRRWLGAGTTVTGGAG